VSTDITPFDFGADSDCSECSDLNAQWLDHLVDQGHGSISVNDMFAKAMEMVNIHEDSHK